MASPTTETRPVRDERPAAAAGETGSFSVAKVAALVGVPLLALVIAWALVPHDFYTGSNSVRTRDFVQPVKTGQRLCVNGLLVPGGTGRLQVELVATTTRPTSIRMRLSTPGSGVQSAVVPVPAGRSKPAFPIRARPSDAAPVPARACFRPTHEVNFGGTLNIGGAAPTVSGKPKDSRIAVWYLPPAGKQRSFVSQLPDVIKRAALFRPGFVGPWTYLLLLLFVPGAALLGVRLLHRARRAPDPRHLMAGVFGVALIIGVAWAFITPPFQAPDEQDHFAYVQHLAETGAAPEQQGGGGTRPPWSSSETIGLRFTRALAANEQADGRPPWLRQNERAWEAVAPEGDRARTDGGGATTAATHGPIYYGAVAPAYLATRHQSLWSQLTASRILSAAIGALAVLFTFLAALELLPGRYLFATSAALLVAFQPMYMFISASVNNDAGINAAAAALMWLLLRALRRGLTPASAIVLGVLIGVLPVIKGTGYALLPVAVVAIAGLLLRRRDSRTLLAAGLVALAFIATTAIWGEIAPHFGRATYTTPGGGSPVGGSSVLHTPGLFVSYLWQVFLPKLPFMVDHFQQAWPVYGIYVERGWAAFGWYTILFAQPVYWVITAVSLLAIPLGALAVRAHWPWARRHWLEILVVLLAPVAVIAAVENAFTSPGARPILAEMGRYAFTAIGPLALIAIGATYGLGRRLAPVAMTAVVVGAAVLTYASQLLTLRGFYT